MGAARKRIYDTNRILKRIDRVLYEYEKEYGCPTKDQPTEVSLNHSARRSDAPPARGPC